MIWDAEDKPRALAVMLLDVYDFEDILEMNGLEPLDVLSILIDKGLIDTYNLDVGDLKDNDDE